MQQKNQQRIIRLKEVQTRVGLSRSSIYRRLDSRSPQHDPAFPRPVSLGGGASTAKRTGPVGFIEADVDAWISARTPAQRYH